MERCGASTPPGRSSDCSEFGLVAQYLVSQIRQRIPSPLTRPAPAGAPSRRAYATRSEASRREREIKQMKSRSYIEALAKASRSDREGRWFNSTQAHQLFLMPFHSSSLPRPTSQFSELARPAFWPSADRSGKFLVASFGGTPSRCLWRFRSSSVPGYSQISTESYAASTKPSKSSPEKLNRPS
jgi:hypothetical protein